MSLIHSEWTPDLSGGYKSYKNPQIRFEITSPNTNCEIVLRRTDANTRESYGLIMFLLKDVAGERSTCKASDFLAQSKYLITRELSMGLKLQPGHYILLCCTEKPIVRSSFSVSFNCTTNPCVLPPLVSSCVRGQWTPESCGGYLSTRNPQLLLQVKEKGRMIITLKMAGEVAREDDALVFFVLKAGAQQTIRKTYSSTEIVAQSPFYLDSRVHMELKIEAGDYVVIPCLVRPSGCHEAIDFDVHLDVISGAVTLAPPIIELQSQTPELGCEDFLSQFPSENSIYYEENIADQLAEYLKERGAKFRDSYFPPDDSSLYDSTGRRANCLSRNVVHSWMRAKDIFSDPKMFVDGIDIRDIKQGDVGNCWLCQGIAAGATSAERIRNLFVPQVYNEHGFYLVRLFHDGAFKYVLVDDYIPCRSNFTPAFAQSEDDNEIWTIILEKAFAKVFGSYEGLTANDPEVALTALTGGTVETIAFSKVSSTTIWDKIQEFVNKKWIIALTSHENDFGSELGIVTNHAYSLINAFELNDGTKLIQIRNTWGHSEWLGDWSDKSSLWTDEVKKLVAYEDLDDGIFFITLDDVIKYFQYGSFCQIISDDYPYSYIIKSTFSKGQGRYNSTANPHYAVKVPSESTKLVIRFSVNINKTIPLRITIVKGLIHGKTIPSENIVCESRYLTSTKVTLECTLSPMKEEYLLYVTSDKDFAEETPFTISISSSHEVLYSKPTNQFPFVQQTQELEWTPCGGYMSSNNPQFKLTIGEKHQQSTSTSIATSDSSDSGSNQVTNTSTAIMLSRTDGLEMQGMRVLVLPYSTAIPVYVKDTQCCVLSRYLSSKDISFLADLTPGEYLIILCLQRKDVNGIRYMLNVKSPFQIDLQKIK